MGPVSAIAADLLRCQAQQQGLLGYERQILRQAEHERLPAHAMQLRAGKAITAMQTLRCNLLLRTVAAANDCATAPALA